MCGAAVTSEREAWDAAVLSEYRKHILPMTPEYLRYIRSSHFDRCVCVHNRGIDCSVRDLLAALDRLRAAATAVLPLPSETLTRETPAAVSALLRVLQETEP